MLKTGQQYLQKQTASSVEFLCRYVCEEACVDAERAEKKSVSWYEEKAIVRLDEWDFLRCHAL